MNFSLRMGILLVTVAVTFPLAGEGQQAPGTDQRVQPAAPATQETAAQAPEEGQPATVTAPSTPLTGVERFTPGSSGQMRSYFFPSFQVFEMGDTNFRMKSGGGTFETVSTMVGSLALQKVGKKNVVALDYSGGGAFFTHHSDFNYTMHQLGITETYQGPRWGFVLDDRASYLPESPFGYAGFGWGGGLGLDLGGASGSNLASLNPAFNPGQSLISGTGSRILNVATAQVSYAPSARSTFTLAASYGLLHFRTPGSINSRDAMFMAGYNRALTARDTIGVSYGYSTFQFPDIDASFAAHFAQLTYGHRITGHLAVSAGGGVELSAIPASVAGSRTTVTSWVANGSVNYNVGRNALALTYYRYPSNGGGVSTGAQTQYVAFTWSRQLTRNWSGSIGPGYARNQNLVTTSSGQGHFTYDSVYANASLSRALGRYMNMFFGYYLQTQRLQAGATVGGNSQTSMLRHVVTFGFDWHPRQILVE